MKFVAYLKSNCPKRCGYPHLSIFEEISFQDLKRLIVARDLNVAYNWTKEVKTCSVTTRTIGMSPGVTICDGVRFIGELDECCEFDDWRKSYERLNLFAFTIVTPPVEWVWIVNYNNEVVNFYVEREEHCKKAEICRS